MLENKDANATIAVKDLDVASRFYEGTLGLKPTAAQNAEVRVYQSGRSKLVVYRSQYAGSNKANAVTWGVGTDLDAIVQRLKSKGVVFEHYDLPGLTRKGDVHFAGEFKAAWFKDPDGNILHINSG
jgi:catechol 2,3-dioxygenase-like lactoylglutathione lyase family enzyme